MPMTLLWKWSMRYCKLLAWSGARELYLDFYMQKYNIKNKNFVKKEY